MAASSEQMHPLTHMPHDTHAHTHTHTRHIYTTGDCSISMKKWSTHGHTHAHTHTHTHTPDSRLLCMFLPKVAIFGLPCTAMMMSQAVISASSVHVLTKHAWRIVFCCLGLSSFAIRFWSPSEIMLLWKSSWTTALASISDMNRSRYSIKTCSAAWKERVQDLQSDQQHCLPSHLEFPELYGRR